MERVKKYLKHGLLAGAVIVVASILAVPFGQWIIKMILGGAGNNTFADSLALYYRSHCLLIILSAMYIAGYLFAKFKEHPASRYVFLASFLPAVWLILKTPSFFAYGVSFMGQDVTGICGMIFGILVYMVALFYIPIFPMCITIQVMEIYRMCKKGNSYRWGNKV